MTTIPIQVRRSPPILKPDQTRVLLRPFFPGNLERSRGIISRIMQIPEYRVGGLLEEVTAELSRRHELIERTFLERFGQVRSLLPSDADPSERRKMLIGSYFVNEYSLESAALFNPSIVQDPDQRGLPAGALRFILSLRATGEGHVSSITFRSGVLYADLRIEVAPPCGFLTEPRQVKMPLYEKPLFERKLAELGLTSAFTRQVMDRLGESFPWEALSASLEAELGRQLLTRGPKGHSTHRSGKTVLPADRGNPAACRICQARRHERAQCPVGSGVNRASSREGDHIELRIVGKDTKCISADRAACYRCQQLIAA